ncbi:homoserine dehydrogenase [Pseudothermotoga sp. U03pept]|uniref:homoserine dehydrogenase n=1 Tax=Pseudothermotoga sp. U03pept TaxID=3447012 RepID=UPI003EFD0049
MDTVKIALLGFGTVGRGVHKVLESQRQKIAKSCGANIEIKKILVRNVQKYRSTFSNISNLFTDDPHQILEDPETAIVVEVMGGIKPAFDYVIEAMKNGKSVVTANKDMIAECGRALFETQRKFTVDLFFEASVAGAIPIVKVLKESLAGDEIREIIGIVNGTTNYILSKMSFHSVDYQDALKEAQQNGYAEADPTSDVEGYDAARKLAILSSIAFNSRIVFKDVYVEGISKITPIDIRYAHEFGGVIKLLAIAKRNEEGIELRVHPTIIPSSHPLAAVNDVFNAIFVEANAAGELMFYGKGAGQLPTASAVVGNIVEAINNLLHKDRGRIGCTCYKQEPLISIEEIVTKYYIRLLVDDKPGVLASVAGAFGRNSVSIESVIQKRRLGELAEVVIITHRAKEKDLQNTVSLLKTLPIVRQIGNVIRVEGDF